MRLLLIGYPLGHSMSPWIHQQFISQHQLNASYHLKEIKPDQFAQTIAALKQSGIDGFNVTIPYKEKIIDYLDDMDETAKRIGAVNTVVCKNGKWSGYNTDGAGYLASLKQHFPDALHSDTRILIIGAGGASRGIVFALLNEPFQSLTVTNRTEARAQTLVEQLESDRLITVQSITEAEHNLKKFDLIINTTSVGMDPQSDELPLDLAQLQPQAIVSDIVYKPLKTKFLTEAESIGGQIHYGHEMLINQAKLSFQLWTGKITDLTPILPEYTKKIKLK